MKQFIGIVLAVVAIALTIFLAAIGFEYLTSDLDGTEEAAGKYVLVVGGFLTAAIWLSAIVLLQGARREKRTSDHQSIRT